MGYYIGLDMGTGSLGWAVTDEKYRLLRARGKDLWGVRMFEEASTSVERRVYRVARRRYQREVARIGVLKEFFADAINQIDPGFYMRMEESKYHLEDRNEENKQPYALFADTGFTDKDYYAKYPTIFHLRKELLESDKPVDIRLVYLAILNMFHHRGHFLNAGDMHTEDKKMDELLEELYCYAEEAGIAFPVQLKANEMEEILTRNDLSRSKKLEGILKAHAITAKTDKVFTEYLKALCGLAFKAKVLYEEVSENEEFLKKSFSFSAIDYDEQKAELEKEIPDEYMELLDKLKEMYDTCLLSNIKKGCVYLSQARVHSYEKHKADLDVLQTLVREYIPEAYDDFFRKMNKDNYSAYIGSVNSKYGKVRRNESREGKPLSQEEFYKSIKKLLKDIPEEDVRKQQILSDIETESFLPKQLTASNGVIPNQLHLIELKKILENASKTHLFFLEKDERGLSVKDKIIQLFQFQIPYYVGPLNDYHKEIGGTAWVVRNETGVVYPWNFEEKINTKESREKFISKMVRHCTYLRGEQVLPKNSLLYQKFMVLNELNNLTVRDQKISVELKQELYAELFEKGKKVTRSQLLNHLIRRGVIQKEEGDVIGGIDGDFKASLSSLGRFKGILGDKAKEWNMQQKLEQIIFWQTVYSNDKKVVRECIEEKFPDVFSEKELKQLLGLKCKDWGRLSKSFLEMEGYSKITGEITSIIQAMWDTNDNLMQLLSGNYSYMEELQKRTEDRAKTLYEFSYEDLDEFALSAPVKRMVWQTILVLKDIQRVLPEEPSRIFVEMARGGGKKGERKTSRKNKFLELYKNCGEQDRQLRESLDQWSDADLRRKKLYLYYMQKGRCMYTGEVIDLDQLLHGNLYDIDHIYPRHYVKDDNIDNNLVLVRKEINAHKSDQVLDEAIRNKQWRNWKALNDAGFINDVKYKRLMRAEPFTKEEMEGFIARQLVETHQGTKVISEILKMVYPATTVVFPKGSNVSDFRREFDLLKVRNVNDFHHANDAYLNIVVGNSYYTKFTNNPRNFVDNYFKDKQKYEYNFGKMFLRDIGRNGKTVWIAPKKDDKEQITGTIKTVKEMMAKNTPILTRMSFEVHGGIAKQTIYSKNVAKEGVYLPVKTGDIRLKDVKKYGGVSDIKAAYYFLVEHTVRKKRVRTLEFVPIYLKKTVEASDEAMLSYCKDTLGLVDPVICMKKIRQQSYVKWNGFYLHLAGRTKDEIIVRNAVPMCLKQKWINYIKQLENFSVKNLEEDDMHGISSEMNIELFHILQDKHIKGVYAKKPRPLNKKIVACEDKFISASIKVQVKSLLELLKSTECANKSFDVPEIGLKTSVMTINKKISDADEMILINQSPSGIFEKPIDLRKV